MLAKWVWVRVTINLSSHYVSVWKSRERVYWKSREILLTKHIAYMCNDWQSKT